MKKIIISSLIFLLFSFTANAAPIGFLKLYGKTLILDDSNPIPAEIDYASVNVTYSGYSQSFTSGGGIIDSVKFYLYKTAGASGNMTALIYAMAGDYATTAKPTGAALATSDIINASTLGQDVANVALITFNFTGAQRVLLTAGYYCVVLAYAGVTSIKMGQDQVVKAHGGVEAYYEASWTNEAYDNIFYVYVYR